MAGDNAWRPNAGENDFKTVTGFVFSAGGCFTPRET